MTFDPNTRTITIEPNNPTQTFVDTEISNIDMLWKLSSLPTASDSLKHDAELFAEWLGQDIGPLTPTSCEKLKTGILGYASNWEAPTPALQRCFDLLQLKKGSYPRPPAEVRDAFDRIHAPNEKLAALIAEKRKYDDLAEKMAENDASPFMQNLQRIYNGDCSYTDDLPKKSINERLLARVHQLSDFTKLFLVVTAVWIMWVWIRTVMGFELVGYYFERWHGDMFLPNVLVVPVLLLVGRYIQKLYSRKYRKNQ